MALPEAMFVALAQQLGLTYLGLEDDFVRFSGDRNEHTISMMGDADAHRFHLIVTHARYPRGLALVPKEGEARALITGDETFDRQVSVTSGGAGALALLNHQVRQVMLALFTETQARITLGRIQVDLVVPNQDFAWIEWALEVTMWIGRRLAHPLTISGLVSNVLDDPHPEVKMTNLRMLAQVAPETLERMPEVHQGLQLAPLVQQARLEVQSAGRLSLADEQEVRGALSPSDDDEGALSFKKW